MTRAPRHCAEGIDCYMFEGSLGAARLNARVQVGDRPDAIRCVHVGRSHKHRLGQSPSTKVYWFKGCKPQANAQTYANAYINTYADQLSPPLPEKRRLKKVFPDQKLLFQLRSQVIPFYAARTLRQRNYLYFLWNLLAQRVCCLKPAIANNRARCSTPP
jgi:hypothetical protein